MRTDIARVMRFLNLLERFSSVPAVELSGNGHSEYSKIPLGGPSARTNGISCFCSVFGSGLGFLKSEVLWFWGRCPLEPRELFQQLDPIKVIEASYSQFDP